MGSYLSPLFLNNINKNDIKLIFELGSRDLEDGNNLSKYYNAKVYSFECNPDCLKICYENLFKFKNTNLNLVEKAVSDTDGTINFKPFDLNLYDNMGASSIFKNTFSNRAPWCEDRNIKHSVQKDITVPSIRLDTFCKNNNISDVNMLCMDLQEAELLALKGMGEYLRNVKYIITEASNINTYEGGCTFYQLDEYLKTYNFSYKCSDRYGYNYPINETYFTFYNCLFVNNSYN
jgi:FkbM family methyltransferase